MFGLAPLEPGASEPPLPLGEGEFQIEIGDLTKALLLNVAPLTTSAESPLFVAIGQDFTERNEFEANLALAHAELKQIFYTASSAMRLIDRDSKVLMVNRTFAELTGIPEEQAVGAACFDSFAGDKCHTDDCPLVRIQAGEHEIEYELKKTRQDGTEVHCLLTARPFLGSDGEPVGIVESFKDVTELVRVQEELRTERDRLRDILFHRFEGVGIIRRDHTIEYQNSTLVDEIGDCVGSPCYTAFCGRDEPCTPCPMEEAIATGRPQQCEMDAAGGRTFEHTYTSFRDANGEEKVLILLRDITERKASRAAVIRSEQLAALGELAAGVAHEINNPINGIINYAQLFQDGEWSQEEVRSVTSKIVAEGNRVANIVEALLSFARRESSLKVPTMTRDLLEDTLTLMGAQIRKDSIQLDVHIDKDLPPISCVPQEIQQVLLNILSNSRYALNQRYPGADPGKRIEIRAIVEPGGVSREVQITVRDHGTGIPANDLRMVMNPFFSTKPKGQGTGLGLSISHETVRQHGGRLLIESRIGEYTDVSVILPEMPRRTSNHGSYATENHRIQESITSEAS